MATTTLNPSSEPQEMFDVLTTTSQMLLNGLETGRYTSVGIVNAYLAQIMKHNHNGLKLNAVISTTPHDILLKRARTLDEERASGKTRSALHGLPILVKDNIMTGPDSGLYTTCGSLALQNVKTKKSADVVDILERAGLIIIGKSNLSVSAGDRT
jgi:amidase